MNIQYDLFKSFDETLLDRFLNYHKKKPEVYIKFKELAKLSLTMGHKRFSARGLFQVMRWRMPGKIKQDGFKYNNNYTPFYVRLLEYECPEFKGFFEKRKSESDTLTLNNSAQ